MKLPKIPIDYSKAGSGEAPFDGSRLIIHGENDFTFGTFYKDSKCWYTDSGPISKRYVTHYTPMPEFYEGGGD